MSPSGILNIYKEEDYTSSDVVVIIRGILRRLGYGKIKVGHAGTLDPMATGVLLVCIGAATKMQDTLLNKDKAYRAGLRFGILTDTEDITGVVTAENNKIPDEDTFRSVVSSFCGVIKQKPPMYSAVKINGQRLYKAARAGKQVERPEREAVIHSIGVTDFNPKGAQLEVVCGKGLYIRTLIKDIGEKAGCFACMDKLCRTRAGNFKAEEALKIREFETIANEGRLEEALWNI